MKFMYVAYIPSAHSSRVILYNILNNFVHETELHVMGFSTCGVLSGIQKVLDFGAVQIWDFWVRDA
jgi:hypothetical protein